MTLCPFSRSTGTTVKPVEEQLGSGLLNFTATNSTLDPGVCVWGCVCVCVCGCVYYAVCVEQHFIFSSSLSGPTITVSSIVLACLMVLIPLWMVLAYKNPTTKGVLFYGWIPVICAMIISRYRHVVPLLRVDPCYLCNDHQQV